MYLSGHLARFGFSRTKSTFWTRGDQLIVQFVSVEHCADELAGYITEIGLPWFECFGSSQGALAPNGPLTDESRVRLRLALDGENETAAIAASRAMLGLST